MRRIGRNLGEYIHTFHIYINIAPATCSNQRLYLNPEKPCLYWNMYIRAMHLIFFLVQMVFSSVYVHVLFVDLCRTDLEIYICFLDLHFLFYEFWISYSKILLTIQIVRKYDQVAITISIHSRRKTQCSHCTLAVRKKC